MAHQTNVQQTATSTTPNLAFSVDEFDWSTEASYTVSGDSNQPNTILALSAEQEDATDNSFAVAANIVTYTPVHKPDYLVITAHEFMNQPSNGAFARIAPELELLRDNVVVGRAASGYQRHATGHDSSSNSVHWVDTNPAAGTNYRLRAQQGSTQNDLLNVDIGHLSIVAHEKKQITYVSGYAPLVPDATIAAIICAPSTGDYVAPGFTCPLTSSVSFHFANGALVTIPPGDWSIPSAGTVRADWGVLQGCDWSSVPANWISQGTLTNSSSPTGVSCS